MSLRDIELLETIRRDDLAFLLTTRYEKPLDSLLWDDCPPMLQKTPSPMMVAAYYGSQKCFNFLMNTARHDYLDEVCLFFMTSDFF
jgi:hypothetical protein